MATMAELKRAYLISGGDEATIDRWRKRVRSRVGEEGAQASLEILKGDRLTPDAAAEAICALTLATGRRYVIADGVERWSDADVKHVEPALASVPADTVVIFIASGDAPKRLVKAVEGSGGEAHSFAGPKGGGYPRWLVEQARELGFELERDAAELLVTRAPRDDRGKLRQQALLRELEKLSVFAGPDGQVDLEAVESLSSSAVEARTYELGDAVIEGDAERALRIAESLQVRGEDMMHILFALLRQLRTAHRAWAMVTAGQSVNEIQSALRVPPFVARRIAGQVRGVDGERLELAIELLADLDYAIRGAGTLDAQSTLILTLTEATGAVGERAQATSSL
jgi:DNA polymerase-3 subunit delta